MFAEKRKLQPASCRSKNFGWAIFLFLTPLLVLAPHEAHAATADSMGALMCRIFNKSMVPGGFSLANFISWLAYITGTFFCAKFLFMLRDHTENPKQNPLFKAILYGFAGGLFMALPSFAGAMVKTLYGATSNVGGAATCTAATVAALTPVVGLDKMAINFAKNISGPAFALGNAVCYILGAVFMYRGVNKMAKYNTDRSASMNAIIANVAFGALLLWMVRAKDVVMGSLFSSGVAVGSKLVYADQTLANRRGLIDWTGLGINTADTVSFDLAFVAVLTFMQVVGFIGFIRGWLLAKSHVEGVGNATMGGALTHIIGGALCMNIIMFLEAMEWTFGVKFLS
ncbi:MAG: hypothetical protein WDO70_00615 [Alphaproteobacteria bacterium]